MDQCFEIFAKITGHDMKEILYGSNSDSNSGSGSDNSDDSERLNLAQFSQAVIFIFEYALAKMLMQWGITPAAMIGYSLGEYIAACLSGVFSLEDTLKLIFERGKLIDETPEGAMLSVPLSAAELRPMLEGTGISLAIISEPSCVVSGPVAAVENFENQMKSKRLLCTRINTLHAIHSTLMNPIRHAFVEKTAQFKTNAPQIPYVSNVSGTWITKEEVSNPGYWGEHLCSAVQFSEGLKELLKEENAVFIEIGPGRVLSNLIRQHPHRKPQQQAENIVRHEQEKIRDDYFLLNKLGRLWQYGVSIDWKAFNGSRPRYRVPLPPYPFEYNYYWIDVDPFNSVNVSIDRKQPLTGQEMEPDPQLSPQDEEVHAPGFVGETNHVSENYVAPRNDLEKKIAQAWEDTLGFKNIGIYDNFFDRNGDSLSATQLISRVQKAFPVEISIQLFFEDPTVAHLAELVKKLLIRKVKQLSPEEKKRLANQ
jgi:acyl transferase domain-containing protein